MSERLRILQVEDSESDSALLDRLLAKAGYEVRSKRVETREEMREALSKQTWDVILCDYHMPKFDAQEALETLHEAGCDIPFLVVSGSIGEDRAVSLMKAGAHDYVLKDNLTRLVPAVEREIREAQSRCERASLEKQFLQAQKLESVGRLAGAVAHDFNNFLTVIAGYSQIALKQLPPHHSLRGSIEEISKATTRATHLARQLLTFSQRQLSEAKNYVLDDVLRDVEQMLARLIGSDIELVLSLHAGAGTILADPGHIEQVIMNLAVNAKDAMPNGGRLLLETANLRVDEQGPQPSEAAPPGVYVMLSVSDTGIGMPAEVKEHLFEPFFTTKQPGKGTGLGLSTVYGIVKQSGGSISVHSEPGHGTRFRILFPAV
jgi:signal transduction histidine kinase